MTKVIDLRGRESLAAFAAGCVAVTIVALLHLPMLWVARDMDFHLAGMAMDNSMMFGTLLIVAGIALAGYGLVPKSVGAHLAGVPRLAVAAPEDAPL